VSGAGARIGVGTRVMYDGAAHEVTECIPTAYVCEVLTGYGSGSSEVAEAAPGRFMERVLDGASLCQEACPLGCRVAGGRSGK